ncbi:MAG TPA: HEAT repeat domain-containing protein, partial [Bryobacteraceae bacterium]
MSYPSAFRVAAVRALRPPCSPERRAYVIKILSNTGMLPFCDPALLSLEEELEIVREAAADDPTLDLKLARRFSSGAEEMPAEVALRVMDLLLAIANNNRVLPLIVKLLHDPNPQLRAKAVRLVARSNMAPKIAERLMTERDPRVRANAVEALWGSGTPATRGLLREATRDGNNRVAGNALLGLYLLGEAGSI